MRQKLLGALAIGALLVAGCESTEPYNQDTNMAGNTFGDWPAPNESAVGSVPGSKQDFMANVGDTVHFATNKSKIDATAKETLSKQAAWLKSWPSTEAMVEGHCDQRGTAEYNMGLGQRRANHAKKALVADGIDAKRLETVSYGKERPKNPENNEAAWSQNRRAVTVIR